MQLRVSILVLEVFLYYGIVKPKYKFMIWFVNVPLLKLVCFISCSGTQVEKQ